MTFLPAALRVSVLGLALALGACVSDQATPGPQAAAAVQSAGDASGGGAGCAGAIGSFEKVINSDVEVGHLNRSVYSRVVADMAPVKASCAAGQDAKARAQLASVKTRYGYP